MSPALTRSAPAISRAPLGLWLDTLLAALPAATGPLAPLQAPARQALLAAPLPCRRLEAWRFTDPAPLIAVAPQWLDGGEPPVLPPGCRLLSATGVAAALAELHPEPPATAWTALFTKAVASRLLAVRVSGRPDAPLELVSDAISHSGVLPLRLLLILEPDAELELLQVHRAAAASLTAVRVDVVLGAGARLRHGLLAQGCPQASLLTRVQVQQAEASTYSLAQVAGGWGLARIEPVVRQLRGAAHTRLRGLQVTGDHQCADTHSLVRFEGPDGTLDQLHRAVVDGSGRSVFNGAVVVPRAAQRTDAAQLSRGLLLSDRARIDTKPELEIVADDVRCSHGATVSRLEQDELFYLQSRGIAADQAASLLLRGFCSDVIEALPAEAARWQPWAGLVPGEER